MLSSIFAPVTTSRSVRSTALAALATLGLAMTAPAAWAPAAAAESQVLQGEELKSVVKLPPKELGPERFDELANGTSTEAQAGAQPAAVGFSGCLLPFFKLKYAITLNGKGKFLFAVAPTRKFDVVMALDFPGFHRRIDRFYAGGTETYVVNKTFAAKVAGKVTISGAGGSYGCFVGKVTP